MRLWGPAGRPAAAGCGEPPRYQPLRRARCAATALSLHGSPREGRRPDRWRRHDADGISDDARAVIERHGLDRGRILDAARRYEAKKGADFNRAPARDFKGAPLGQNMVRAAYLSPAFGKFRDKFDIALESLDYGATDAILDECLRAGIIADPDGNGIYGAWKLHAERLEGLNAALYRAARSAVRLNRFIGSLGELDNYKRGRWRRDGDAQDRVPATVGRSNRFLAKEAVARVSYAASALAGWTQPVRYSPYPRTLDVELERFGDEKGGHLAGEGEVHIHAGCPIPALDYIKIALLPHCRLGRQDVVERYGEVGMVDRIA